MKPNQVNEAEDRRAMRVILYLLGAFVVAVALASCLLAVIA